MNNDQDLQYGEFLQVTLNGVNYLCKYYVDYLIFGKNHNTDYPPIAYIREQAKEFGSNIFPVWNTMHYLSLYDSWKRLEVIHYNKDTSISIIKDIGIAYSADLLPERVIKAAFDYCNNHDNSNFSQVLYEELNIINYRIVNVDNDTFKIGCTPFNKSDIKMYYEYINN